MKNVILKLDKIKINFQYDKDETLDKVKEDFSGFMEFSHQKQNKSLYTVTSKEMKSLKQNENYKYFFSNEPNDPHFNRVGISKKDVLCEYNPNNDYTTFSSYVVLNTMMKIFENSGYFFLHSSCVEKEGSAIAFCGEKGAGKTATMINLIQNGYNLVTNDKLGVRLSDDEKSLVCVGFPTSVGIRLTSEWMSQKNNMKIVQTLKQKDRDKLNNVLKPANVNNLADESRKYFFMPRVLTDAYKQDIVPISNLVQIVNPKFNPTTTKFESKNADLINLIKSQQENAVSIEKPYLNNVEFTPFEIDTNKVVERMAGLDRNIEVSQGPDMSEDLLQVIT